MRLSKDELKLYREIVRASCYNMFHTDKSARTHKLYVAKMIIQARGKS